MIKRILFFVFLGLALSIPEAYGNTIFSFQGLGSAVRRVDARSRSMGGSGRALIDGFNFSAYNPALLAGFQRPSVSVQFITQRRSLTGAGSVNDGDLSGFHIAIPVGKTSVFGVALAPLTDMDFGAIDTVGTGDLGYELQLDASGGVQAISIGLGHRLGTRIYTGAQVDWVVLGTLNETWTKEFFGQNIFFSRDEIVRTHRGWVPSVGIIFTPSQHWSTGASLQMGRSIRQRTVLTTRFVSSNADLNIETRTRVKLPHVAGFGVSYLAGYRWLAAFDVERGFWGDTAPGRFHTWDIGAGVLMRTGSSDPLVRSRRWELTAGMHYRTLYFPTVSGKQIAEVGASFGFALPFKNESGRFRYVLEVGSRGSKSDQGIQERFIQQSFSVTGFFQ